MIQGSWITVRLLWDVLILAIPFYPTWRAFKPLDQILQIKHIPKNKASGEQILVLFKNKANSSDSNWL